MGLNFISSTQETYIQIYNEIEYKQLIKETLTHRVNLYEGPGLYLFYNNDYNDNVIYKLSKEEINRRLEHYHSIIKFLDG